MVGAARRVQREVRQMECTLWQRHAKEVGTGRPLAEEIAAAAQLQDLRSARRQRVPSHARVHELLSVVLGRPWIE
ncbi:hypothetical protein AB1Y20_009908 [Prymnesium parvum]|uniref:Uncharacterized protein n=1 Tax=Prymnesium parvum TaxID=97485 RepID=A0AB34K5S0_PRYPA